MFIHVTEPVLCNRQRAPDVLSHPIFLKRFDPPNILGFARGLKSIRSALLNLVELGPYLPNRAHFRVYFNPSATCFTFLTYDTNNKANQNIMKLTQIFRGRGQSDP